jgi:phosphatidylserine/phosphatidylglycerophosphate/cardiolipin synthase-like enzyme
MALYSCPDTGYYHLEISRRESVKTTLGRMGFTGEQGAILLEWTRVYLVPGGKGRVRISKRDLNRPVYPGDALCIPECLPLQIRSKLDPTTKDTSILIGGREISKAIARAIICAEKYIYIVIWSVDPQLNFSLPDGTILSLHQLLDRTLEKNPYLTVYVIWTQITKKYADWGTPESIRRIAFELFKSTHVNRRVKIVIARRDPKSVPDTALAEVIDELYTLGSVHTKLLVVDGEIAFCGSANLNKWSMDETNVHEVTAEVKGIGAKLLNNMFAGMWNRELKKTPNFSQGLSDVSDSIVEAPINWKRLLDADISVSISEPDAPGEQCIGDVYYQQIRNAQKHIYVENQYFRHQYIAAKLRNWVEEDPRRSLTIVIPESPEEIRDPDNLTGQDQLTVLATIKSLHHLTVKLRFPLENVTILSPKYDKPYIHSKLIITDPLSNSATMFIGSANLNPRGLDGKVDHETNLLIMDAEVVNNAYKRLRDNHSKLNLQPHNLLKYIELEEKIVPFIKKIYYPFLEFLA